jgi:hypothetical protein
MVRTRTELFYEEGGSCGRFMSGPAPTSSQFISESHSITDQENMHAAHLQIDKRSAYGGVINRAWTDYFAPWFDNYVCDFVRSDLGLTEHLAVDSPSDTEVAVKAHNRTSPSRPYVDLAQNVGELKDFPSLFRIRGQQLLDLRKAKIPINRESLFSYDKDYGITRTAAELNLNYQFGWKPLMSDALKLLDFSAQFDKRVDELKRLQDKRGLRRTTRHGTYYAEEYTNTYVQSVYRLISRPMVKRTEQEVWAFTNWMPTADFPSSSRVQQALARRAVLGITIDASTAWELFPFSWLADWCVNVGDMLTASRNIIPAEHGPVQVMRRTRTTTFCPGYEDSSDGLTMTRIDGEYISKSRRLASPSFVAHFPFLNARRMSILGSIGLLSGLPRQKTRGRILGL